MEYREGSTIRVNNELVLVTTKDDDIKNGEPGFEGRVLENNERMIWNYDSEIDSVVIF